VSWTVLCCFLLPLNWFGELTVATLHLDGRHTVFGTLVRGKEVI